MNSYELTVRATCPVHDGLIDVYDVTVESSATIPVETILSFFEPFETQKIYQEELTARAATALGAHVQIVGCHSGVTVRSVAP